MADRPNTALAPETPRARLCLGVTGHRLRHTSMSSGAGAIERAVKHILDTVAAIAGQVLDPALAAPTRLHTLLADGADQMFAHEALQRGWDIVAPLPLGADLYRAISARPATAADALALLGGQPPSDPETAQRAAAVHALYESALLFELGDADAAVQAEWLRALETQDEDHQNSFEASLSARVALAARVMLEQSDLILAVWDGAQTSFVGGTGHTVQTALAMGAGVILIDPASPADWRVLRAPEALAAPAQAAGEGRREDQLAEIVRDALAPRTTSRPDGMHGHRPPAGGQEGVAALDASNWRARSNPLWHAYRRIESLFGADRPLLALVNLRQTYETPDRIANGSGAPILRALRDAPAADPAFADRVARLILPRFAWSDGISAYLSDTYRGGMTINFVLSAAAIIGGIAYLPLVGYDAKWGFALFELALLSAILFITQLGQRKRWHGRWFETRRAAEYLRHAPILLALGAARAPGQWPRGGEVMWPEWYARHALREVGLPRQRITGDYLRHCLQNLLDRHVAQQRDYHRAKAQRLSRVHHNLDRLSESLFQLAVASVASFLLLQIGAWAHLVDDHAFKSIAKFFTFFAVALPTMGGAIAGIRYFGDFERFAAISQVTAQKLDAVHVRIAILLQAPTDKLDYAAVADLTHAADDIVVSEIENWQAVFGGKQITVPV